MYLLLEIHEKINLSTGSLGSRTINKTVILQQNKDPFKSGIPLKPVFSREGAGEAYCTRVIKIVHQKNLRKVELVEREGAETN